MRKFSTFFLFINLHTVGFIYTPPIYIYIYMYKGVAPILVCTISLINQKRDVIEHYNGAYTFIYL